MFWIEHAPFFQSLMQDSENERDRLRRELQRTQALLSEASLGAAGEGGVGPAEAADEAAVSSSRPPSFVGPDDASITVVDGRRSEPTRASGETVKGAADAETSGDGKAATVREDLSEIRDNLEDSEDDGESW